jgi:hypothetical protein
LQSNKPYQYPKPDRRGFIASTTMACSTALIFHSGVAKAAAARDNHQRDWQWLEGSWDVSHRRLQKRLANDTHWDEFSGKSTVWLTMRGLGTIDDNILQLPGGVYRAAGIRAFDPKAGKWLIWWLDGRNPTQIDPPVLGRFNGDEGEFIGDDTLNGKPIVVRFRWHETRSKRPHWDQAFSSDGGKTWEINWTNAFTRTSPTPISLQLINTHPQDFDFLVGSWRVKHRRLRKRLVGDQEWDTFGGTLINWPVLGGHGNVGDNVMEFPTGVVRGVGIRAFDPARGQWSSWWLDGRSPSEIGKPLRGRFENGVGTFLSDEMLDDRRIFNRVIWSGISAQAARWEQASSLDGQNWEINWVSDFTRVK